MLDAPKVRCKAADSGTMVRCQVQTLPCTACYCGALFVDRSTRGYTRAFPLSALTPSPVAVAHYMQSASWIPTRPALPGAHGVHVQRHGLPARQQWGAGGVAAAARAPVPPHGAAAAAAAARPTPAAAAASRQPRCGRQAPAAGAASGRARCSSGQGVGAVTVWPAWASPWCSRAKPERWAFPLLTR